MPFCSECGADVTGMKFCAECGAKVAATQSKPADVSFCKPCADSSCSLKAVPGKQYCVQHHNIHILNIPTTVKPVSKGIAATAQNFKTPGDSGSLLAPTLDGTTKVSTREQAVGITSTVRAYQNVASDEEKNKKYNQQKWGLFETNYQRTKGITTEQSLQEIERTFGSGTPVQNQAGKREFTVTSSSAGSSGSGYGGAGSSDGAKGGNSGTFGSAGLSGGRPLNAGKFGGSSKGFTNVTTEKVSDGKRVYGGEAKFGPGGGGGAALCWC